jgi:hypothetical protein
MKKSFLLLFTVFIEIMCVNGLTAEEWLNVSKSFSGGNWIKMPGNLYLDLGSDSEALRRLEKYNFVIDSPEVKKSSSLECKNPLKKYLVRSFFLGSKNASIYMSSEGLLVSSGAFSDPRPPERGAVAVCLSNDPTMIQGAVSFLK